jgi:hypothetical protein
MVNARERYSLRPTRSAQDWIAYHAIRRDAIFAPLLPGEVYDESDPNEFAPGKLPHVLICNDEIVGTVRIDLIDDVQAWGYGFWAREPSSRPGMTEAAITTMP